jgi:hypothetical protein
MYLCVRVSILLFDFGTVPIYSEGLICLIFLYCFSFFVYINIENTIYDNKSMQYSSQYIHIHI